MVVTRSPAARVAASPLRQLDAVHAAQLVATASDLALVLDGHGVVQEVFSNDRDLRKAGQRDWRGRQWSEIVNLDSRDKVAEMLRDAQVTAPIAARWRQINMTVKGAADLPVLFAATLANDSALGAGERQVVAFGRDLRPHVDLQRRLIDAQQSMERDHWRFREAETRYRSLFQATDDAVLIVDGADLKVTEANPAALGLCRALRSKLVGATLASLFDISAGESLQTLLAAARSVGKHEELTAPLAGGGPVVAVSATLFRQDQAAFLMVRLAPPADRAGARVAGVASASGAADSGAGGQAMLATFLRSTADGLVFTDVQGRVVTANRAFAALAQLSTEERARGEPLDRWLGRTGVEIGVLMSNLRERGAVGLYTTELRGELGATAEVEISASRLEPAGDASYAFAVRDIGRRLRPDESKLPSKVPQSVKQLTELVGRVPLKDIVAESSELIEQLSIETALQMTHDNRALAAQLLGLSRQSLYVKLRRYGLGDLPGADTK